MTISSCACPRCASRIRAVPLVLYGHSLGGLIALGYVLSEQPRPQPDLLVLSAPALDDNLAGWKRPLAAMLTNVVPKMQLANGVPGGQPSRATRPSKPRRPSIRCARTSRRSASGRRRSRSRTRVKAALAALISHADPDLRVPRFGRPAGPRWARARSSRGRANVTRQVHEGLRHECHHEPEHEEVLAERGRVDPRRTLPATPLAVPPRPADEAPGRCRLRRQPHIRLRGAPRALRVWCRPQTRGT